MEATESPAIDVKHDNVNTQTDHAASAGPVTVGDVLLKRFMLMREIGSGGSSRVFRARDLLAVLGGNLAESDVALKLASIPKHQEEIDGSSLLLREALSTRHLSHPNILKVYDYHRDGDNVFVTMELVEGEPLNQLVKLHPDGILDYKRVVSIIDPVVAGLKAAHDAGIIHSDIKPSNILLSNNGDVKVIDFATSRPTLQGESEKSDFHAYTLAYASPQLLKDEPPSVGDDIYSLACVVYELLGGHQANASKISQKVAKISDQTESQKRQKSISYRPKKERIKPAGINQAQWRVLKHAMSSAGCKSFTSIEEFWQKFKRARHTQYRVLGSIAALGLAASIFAYLYHNVDLPNIVINQDSLTEANASLVNTTESVIESIAQLPLQERLQHLANIQDASIDAQSYLVSLLDKGDDVVIEDSAYVLNRLKPDTIQELSDASTNALNYDSNQYQIPNFQSILALVELAQRAYPDSLTVSELNRNIQQEKEHLITYLRLEYSALWQRPDKSIASAHSLNTIIQNLHQLGSRAPADDSSAVESLLASIKSAADGADVVRYYELVSFGRALSDHDKLTTALQGLDPNRFNAAKAIVDYAKDGQTNENSYPTQAAELWLRPSINSINDNLTTAWKDKDITSLHARLDDIAAQFHTTAANPAFEETVSLLDEKYSMKIKYYQTRQFLKSLASLRSNYERLPKGPE